MPTQALHSPTGSPVVLAAPDASPGPVFEFLDEVAAWLAGTFGRPVIDAVDRRGRLGAVATLDDHTLRDIGVSRS